MQIAYFGARFTIIYICAVVFHIPCQQISRILTKLEMQRSAILPISSVCHDIRVRIILAKFRFFREFTKLFILLMLRVTVTLLRQKPKRIIKGLEKELGDSIDCPDCYPLCSLSRYLVQASYSEIATDEITEDAWGIM